MRWMRGTEVIDGTFRHALPIAPDGDRFYALLFGVRTYVLVARSTADGSELWRVQLTSSSRGQTNMLAGAPVRTQGGLVVAYLNAGDVPEGGALMAFRRDGSPVWRVAARASQQQFFDHATHIAASDGTVYLAVGSQLLAVREGDGQDRWRVTLPGAANTAAPMLSPTGDLALHSDDNRLLVYVTDSHELATSGWPGALGGRERRNVANP
ncbi:MAG: PQQ-binding-like beta-propeller repeat protein, partial [Deltaproteobacteria bacterium]